ncbi:hypothetical protein L208DRAFT_1379198 [Tricholoma matsutake]|nr:hypothetical protein L208DRAFT_1379198 [Tricholoma matsutake 945]
MTQTCKSQKAPAPVVPLTPALIPSATKTGHQRTYTSKQMENAEYNINGVTSDDGDNENKQEDTFFSSVTLLPPIKTVICNGCSLAHFFTDKENDSAVGTPVFTAQSQDINECYWNRPKQRNFNMHPPSNAHQFSNVLPMSSMHLVPIHLEFSLMMGMLMELTTLITNIMRMWSSVMMGLEQANGLV